jgi:serine O-acetyltransferase
MSNFNQTLNLKDLVVYIDKQLNNMFPDEKTNDKLGKYVQNALERIEYCFNCINSKYYNNGSQVLFNHLNGDHYSTFLYFVSNEAYKDGNEMYYQKISMLNKIYFSIDLFGHIEMPKIFLLVHPIGSIIGRAQLNDYLVIYQGVTIGGVKKNNVIHYPTIGENVICYSNTSILGNSKIGNNVILGAGTHLVNELIENNKTVITEKLNLKLKDNSMNDFSNFLSKRNNNE